MLDSSLYLPFMPPWPRSFFLSGSDLRFTKGPFFSFSNNKRPEKETSARARRETGAGAAGSAKVKKEPQSRAPLRRHGNHLPVDVTQAFGLMCNHENEEQGTRRRRWEQSGDNLFFFKRTKKKTFVLLWLHRHSSLLQECKNTERRGA